MFIGFNVPIYLGAATVMLARFDPVAVMEAVEKYSCTVWYSLTPMNIAILNSPLKGDYNLSSLKVNLCSSFGIALTEEISRQWKDLTGGCRLFESSYGLSETHGLDTFMPLNRIKFGTVGIPSHECQIKIVDWETGEDLGVNREGEIVVKNPGVFKGYWKRPEETQKVLKEGWLYTGDVGKMDEEGYLYFYGRKKEMIKCSGYSVFPEEVEMLLLKHPAIAQAAVIGIPDEKRGQTVKAFVVLRPDMKGRYTEQDIIDWSKERMAAYKYPRHVQFLEQLPMSGSGKVLRRLLEDGSITK
jgi:long-chain acyl-CoA synthetase